MIIHLFFTNLNSYKSVETSTGPEARKVSMSKSDSGNSPHKLLKLTENPLRIKNGKSSLKTTFSFCGGLHGFVSSVCAWPPYVFFSFYRLAYLYFLNSF